MELYSRRILTNRIGIGLSMIAMAFGLAALMWILWTLFSKGFAALSWDFFTQDTPAPGSEGGGRRTPDSRARARNEGHFACFRLCHASYSLLALPALASRRNEHCLQRCTTAP